MLSDPDILFAVEIASPCAVAGVILRRRLKAPVPLRGRPSVRCVPKLI